MSTTGFLLLPHFPLGSLGTSLSLLLSLFFLTPSWTDASKTTLRLNSSHKKHTVSGLTPRIASFVAGVLSGSLVHPSSNMLIRLPEAHFLRRTTISSSSVEKGISALLCSLFCLPWLRLALHAVIQHCRSRHPLRQRDLQRDRPKKPYNS